MTTEHDTPSVSEAMPLVRETRIDNGMRVVSLVPDKRTANKSASDVAVFQLRLMAGSALDGDMPGLGRFTTLMLSRGSAGKNLETIAEELDSLGATLGFGCGRLTIDGTTKSLAADAEVVLGYLVDALRKPDFPQDQVEIIRAQMLSGLRQAENSTRALANRTMREMVYPEGHPFHNRASGTVESVSAIDRSDLIAFHERAFQPDNAIVAVAGGIDHDAAVALVEQHLGDWTGTPPEIDIQTVDPPAELRRHDDTLPGKTQADLAMGLPSINREHPDYYALSVANLIIGRFGLYGRLGESVRERQGMAYYAYSQLQAGKRVGLWVVNAGVAPENVDRAIDSIIAEVNGFNEGGPTEREYADATGSILGSLPLGLETSGSQAATAGDIVFHNLGHDYLQRYRDIIRSLTPEQITDAARRHLDTSRLTVAVVGPDRE
ncbi:MAG: pitrilysin family protein [Thermomicrobiales bacterium]